MAKRDIERALKAKGIRIESLVWEWQPTPEEMVPCWSLSINDDDADRFGIDSFIQFDNTAHALCEIEEWEPLQEEATNDR